MGRGRKGQGRSKGKGKGAAADSRPRSSHASSSAQQTGGRRGAHCRKQRRSKKQAGSKKQPGVASHSCDDGEWSSPNSDECDDEFGAGNFFESGAGGFFDSGEDSDSDDSSTLHDDDPRVVQQGVASGSSEGDRVVRELLAKGAEPAVVGKRKHGLDQPEVELELFTRSAAKKARIIRDDSPPVRRRCGGSGGFGGFGSFFSGFPF